MRSPARSRQPDTDACVARSPGAHSDKPGQQRIAARPAPGLGCSRFHSLLGLRILSENPIQFIVAADGQHFLAHRLLAHIQPVETLLAVWRSLLTDQLNPVENGLVPLGEFGQPDRCSSKTRPNFFLRRRRSASSFSRARSALSSIWAIRSSMAAKWMLLADRTCKVNGPEHHFLRLKARKWRMNRSTPMRRLG
jgi:hypothetical protein